MFELPFGGENGLLVKLPLRNTLKVYIASNMGGSCDRWGGRRDGWQTWGMPGGCTHKTGESSFCGGMLVQGQSPSINAWYIERKPDRTLTSNHQQN